VSVQVPNPASIRHFSVVTETYPPEVNGVAATVARLVSGLRGCGHTVTVIRPSRHDNARGLGTPVRGLRLPGCREWQLGFPASRLLQTCWSRRRPHAIYVATEGPLGYSAVRTAERLGIPAVSGFHTNFDGYARHYRAAALARPLFSYLRHFHNRTGRTLVPTIELRDRLHALGFRNLRVLHRGVDTELFDPARRSTALRAAWGASPDDLVVLHVGRLAPEKNLPLALRAYRGMQRSSSTLRLVIVGDGPLRPALERANPDVIFTGLLGGERLAEHYASADVFLFPSETETFGNVTIEAMASGLAVVAYDYAAARLHIRDGESGVLVPHGDARAFVTEAAMLVRRPLGLSRMRQGARERVMPVGWGPVVERFASILSSAGGEEAVAGEGRVAS
jgi:glycosyltransferase involved in cell wall biosynthesis